MDIMSLLIILAFGIMIGIGEVSVNWYRPG